MNSRIVFSLALLLSLTSQLIGQDFCFIKFGLNTSGMYPYYESVCGRSPDSYDAAEANAEAVAKAMGLKDPIGGWEIDCSFSKCAKVAIPVETSVTTQSVGSIQSPCAVENTWEVEFTVYCTNGTSIPPVRMPGDSYCAAYCAAKRAALQIAEFSGCTVCRCSSKVICRPAPPACCPIICR